jgi:hypothetical protein
MHFDTRPLAPALRRHGFRKWYERELLGAHAHLLLTLLSVIGLMAALEAFHSAGPDARMLNLGLVLVCVGTGLWSLRRYLFRLMHAEALAHQATCTQCGRYGQFQLLGDGDGKGALPVRCRHCGHGWHLFE